MKSERFGERARSKAHFPEMDSKIPQLIFRSAERGPSGEWLVPEPPPDDREGQETGRVWTAMIVPLWPGYGICCVAQL